MARRADRPMPGRYSATYEELRAVAGDDPTAADYALAIAAIALRYEQAHRRGPASHWRSGEQFFAFMRLVSLDMERHYCPFTLANSAAWITRKIQNAAAGPIYGEHFPMSVIHMTTLEAWCNRWAGGFKELRKSLQNKSLQ